VSYRIVIRGVAEDDIAAAAKWYERQRAGLGRDFVASVRASLDKLRMHPDLGIVVFKDLRRCNVKRFPYGIFYVIDDDCPRILGVIHARRAPRVWKKRLS
jgi:toxin ParE1/3/4